MVFRIVKALLGLEDDEAARGKIGDPEIAKALGEEYDASTADQQAAIDAQYQRVTIQYAAEMAARYAETDEDGDK